MTADHHPRLARLIRNRLAELNLTYREAAGQADGLVSFSVLHTLANDDPYRVSEKTIKGVALALQVSEQTIRESL